MTSVVDPALIARIKEAALNLPIDCHDTIFLDLLLGCVEDPVHEARQAIDDDWRQRRQAQREHCPSASLPEPPTLDDLA